MAFESTGILLVVVRGDDVIELAVRVALGTLAVNEVKALRLDDAVNKGTGETGAEQSVSMG